MQGARRENREARWTGEPTQRGRAPRRRSPGTALPTRSRQITAGPRPSGRARRTGRRPPAGKRARGQSLSAERRDDHPPAGRRGPVSAHREKAEAWREQNPAGGQVRKGPPVSGRRRRPAPVGGAGGEILTGTGRARRRVPAGAARGAAGPGDLGGGHPARGDQARRRPRNAPERPGSRLPAASHQKRHGCAQKRFLMKSLKSEARVLPWRRSGGFNPALAATPPRFLLLLRQAIGRSPIGQFKPPREPLGCRHLGPAPGVTEMPRPTRSSTPFRATRSVARETRDAIDGPGPGLRRPGLPHRSRRAFPPPPFLPCLQPSSVPQTQRSAQLLAYSL